MSIVDVHTHRSFIAPNNAIWSLEPSLVQSIPSGYYHTVGLHPWHLLADNIDSELSYLHTLSLKDPYLVGIGETGLDKLCNTSWSLQCRAFEAQALLAQSLGLPLILHVVRAHQEVLHMHKRLSPTVPWIIHGFRGSPELMIQYASQGFYLSFNHHANIVSFCRCPAQQILVETDDSGLSIFDVISILADKSGLERGLLNATFQSNLVALFF